MKQRTYNVAYMREGIVPATEEEYEAFNEYKDSRAHDGIITFDYDDNGKMLAISWWEKKEAANEV